LNVSGESTLLGATTALSTLNVSGRTTLLGGVTAVSTLNVSGNSILQGPISAISTLNVSGNSILQGPISAISTLNVSGSITAVSNLNISGNATLNNTTINETLQINKITMKPINSFNLVTNDLINLTNGLAFLNPSSDVVGIRLSSSSITGATSILVNKSEFTIEFAETGSNMIAPTTTFIYPQTTVLIVWDGSNWIPTRDA
jgi:hypothetical protein